MVQSAQIAVLGAVAVVAFIVGEYHNARVAGPDGAGPEGPLLTAQVEMFKRELAAMTEANSQLKSSLTSSQTAATVCEAKMRLPREAAAAAPAFPMPAAAAPCPACPAAASASVDTSGATLDTFVDDMNKLCELVVTSQSEARKKVAIASYIFCIAHTKQFKRGYDYTWDTTEGTKMGYYRGQELPPHQMSVLQYFTIVTTIASIPAKPLKDIQEQLGSSATDTVSTYHKLEPEGQTASFFGPGGPRGKEGPRILFWGCGTDTPMYAALTDYLGGSLVVVDNSEEWAEMCREMGAKELYIVEHTGDVSSHNNKLGQASLTGSDNVAGSPNEALFADENMVLPAALTAGAPIDVVVVDGPVGGQGKSPGRSQSLQTAVRLAQSYSPNHYTHIFFHDAARFEAVLIANVLLGHDPSVYHGNTLPRKGLKHWRIPGQNRPFTPPTSK